MIPCDPDVTDTVVLCHHLLKFNDVTQHATKPEVILRLPVSAQTTNPQVFCHGRRRRRLTEQEADSETLRIPTDDNRLLFRAVIPLRV